VWDVEFTDQFEACWDTLSAEDQQSIDAAVRLLEQRGPGLGRPLVDSIEGSRHANMKELRAGTLRVLFAFDPRRTAILLIGGDKRGPLAGVLRTDDPARRRLVRRAPGGA
jgi:hypothetical protein